MMGGPHVCLCSLQDALSKEQLKLALEMELVSRINDVGVDINYCLEHPHIAPLASFVCGLGPRKAAALMKVWALPHCCHGYSSGFIRF